MKGAMKKLKSTGLDCGFVFCLSRLGCDFFNDIFLAQHSAGSVTYLDLVKVLSSFKRDHIVS